MFPNVDSDHPYFYHGGSYPPKMPHYISNTMNDIKEDHERDP